MGGLQHSNQFSRYLVTGIFFRIGLEITVPIILLENPEDTTLKNASLNARSPDGQLRDRYHKAVNVPDVGVPLRSRI